jgi:hypothetical protein
MFSGRVIAFLSGLMKGSFLCISGRNGLIYPTLISALLTVCFVDLDLSLGSAAAFRRLDDLF